MTKEAKTVEPSNLAYMDFYDNAQRKLERLSHETYDILNELEDRRFLAYSEDDQRFFVVGKLWYTSGEEWQVWHFVDAVNRFYATICHSGHFIEVFPPEQVTAITQTIETRLAGFQEFLKTKVIDADLSLEIVKEINKHGAVKTVAKLKKGASKR